MHNTSECQTNVAHGSTTCTRVNNIIIVVVWRKPCVTLHHLVACLRECLVCPGTHLLKEELVTLLEKSDVDEIIFKQWVSTDRSTLDTFCLPPEDFVYLFCEKLEVLQPHSFIAKQQAAFFQVVR